MCSCVCADSMCGAAVVPFVIIVKKTVSYGFHILLLLSLSLSMIYLSVSVCVCVSVAYIHACISLAGPLKDSGIVG
jgi:hypothetical protein